MRFLHNLVGTYTKVVVIVVVVVILNRTEIGNFVSGNHVKGNRKKLFLFTETKIDEKRLRQVTTDLGLTITLDLT